MLSETISCRFTVLFQDPFWVGIYERSQGGRLEVCKITFGAEPRDAQVLDFLLAHWRGLRFSPPVAEGPPREKPHNPKRAQREARAQLQAGRGVGTKAQQALQLQREQGREERVSQSRRRREEERELQFALRQERRKEKHRGR